MSTFFLLPARSLQNEVFGVEGLASAVAALT